MSRNSLGIWGRPRVASVGLLPAQRSLINQVLLLTQESRIKERHQQLQQGRVVLLPAALPLRVALGVNQ